MRVSVVATGIDDEAIISQQTVVEPARRSEERIGGRRPYVAPRGPEHANGRQRAEQPPRPSFVADAGRPAGGGFSFFGKKKPPPAPAPAPMPAEVERDEPTLAPEEAPPPRALATAARDSSLDEELEIPAFLRRQMGPR